MTDSYSDAIGTADVAPGRAKEVKIQDQRILISHVDGQFYATDASCSHYHAALERGRIKDGWITCPWHGAQFELSSGKCAANMYPALKSYPVKVEGDRILVNVEAGKVPA